MPATYDFIDEQTCLQQLQDGALALTPNQRLSVYMHERVRQHATRNAWPSPEILPLTTWLCAYYDKQALMQPLPRRLNANQSNHLWRLAMTDEQVLLAEHSTRARCQSAWQLCQEWLLDLNDEAFSHTSDSQQFQTWALAYQQLCTQYNCLDTASLGQALLPLCQPLSRPLILIGFTELTPLWQQLLPKLSDNIVMYMPHSTTSSCAYTDYADDEDELRHMLAWAQAAHAAGASSVACVLPDLAGKHERMRQLCWQQAQTTGIFNISASSPLADRPVIYTALQILRLRQVSDLETWLHLLRSPYTAGAEQEFSARAQLAFTLQDQGEARLTVPQVLALAAKQDGLSQWQKHCHNLLQLSQQPQTFSQWCDDFSAKLRMLGWPGERLLDSHEYQAVQRFKALFTQIVNLDVSAQTLPLNQALRYFSECVQQTAFQPQSQQEPIQILGLLEAAGMTFDAMWVAGMHDHAWPTRVDPNPFIPVAIQKQKQLPRATQARELFFAKQITAQLKRAANTVIFSYARAQGDCEVQLSPLLQGLPHIAIDATPSSKPWQAMRQNISLETWQETHGTALAASQCSGGSFIIKEQAACAFRAFARFRLGLQAPATYVQGFDALERGILLHGALEHFWKAVKSQQQLLALSATQLLAQIDSAITNAMPELLKHRPNALTAAVQTLEHERSKRILLAWLEGEQQRPGFTVQAIEQAITTSVGGLDLRLRIDRIDVTDSGETLVIDYKTGLNNLRDLFGARLAQPQLPLYAISVADVSGLAFAQLRAGKMQWLGVSCDDMQLPGVRLLTDSPSEADNWTIQLQQWRAELGRLGEEFKSGYAVANPQTVSLCQHCEFANLCRIAC